MLLYDMVRWTDLIILSKIAYFFTNKCAILDSVLERAF